MSSSRVCDIVVFSRVAAFAVAIVGRSVEAAGAAAPDPAETMARIARDLDLQTQMPDAEPPKPEFHFSPLHWHIPGSIAEWVLWMAIAVAVGFAAYALRDALPGRARRSGGKPARTATILPTEAAVARLAEAGEDADALASRGRFAEAMHMLLLRSLAEMRKSLDVTIADSLTSREILRRIALPETGRGALADLITRVEPVHFGVQAAAQSDYGACRASFEALLGAMRAPGAARAPA